jgi:DNA-binding transcriptional MerR regulator
MPIRKVRFYIQKGLVSPPSGTRKMARYGAEQVEQLLNIRKWQTAGLSLDRIQSLLHQPTNDELLPPLTGPTPGQVSVVSQVYLAPGVSLHIDPQACGLTTDHIRQLSEQMLTALALIQQEGTHDDTQ